jgi:outer membrane protein assembly factor BamB
VPRDHQGESFIVALDKRTGEERWRMKRDAIDSWPTPLVVVSNGRPQVVTSGMKQVRSYDLETGKLLWHGGGLTINPIPSPVAAVGIVILASGFRGNNLKAVRVADARDDITNSPALVKSNSGILSAFDAATGKPHYQLARLDARRTSSRPPPAPAAACTSPAMTETPVVLKHGPAFEVLAQNKLDDRFNASPALVD